VRGSERVTRRSFIKCVGAGSAALVAPAAALRAAQEAAAGVGPRPNILWITSEDNGPFFGCYGDAYATTPNFDRLASEGVLCLNAFANAPVCAPARSTIISGMYACSLGTHPMRSTYAIPSDIKFFPQYLREAGYYCTNCSKEDYNMRKPPGTWDDSSAKAHYRNRQAGQPFFAVFNLTVSHESSIHKSAPKTSHDPAKAPLPPYHPDTPTIRHDWAQYYDKVQALDAQVGGILANLEKDGLAEDTIVFYYSDHGGVLPRSKRFLYDTGTRVPMIVRFPKKYQHLAPGKPGTRTDRLVSFVDLAPTVLGLAGIPVPENMQGEAFLGPEAREPREYVYLFRARMDERYDMMRAVRDKQFKYIRNYMPHRIYGQYLEYLWKMPATRSWEEEYKAGRCNPTQSIFWGPKPAEELYDVAKDPYEVNNLAANPAHADVLERMRRALRDWILKIRDTGFLPEGDMVERTAGTTAYELVRRPGLPLERIVETAEMATDRNARHLPELVKRLKDPDSAVRYWAATGCVVLGEQARSAADALAAALADSSGDVRIAAAEALFGLGMTDKALPVLKQALADKNPRVVLHAVNVIQCLGEKAVSLLPAVERAMKDSGDNYVDRAGAHVLKTLGKNSSGPE